VRLPAGLCGYDKSIIHSKMTPQNPDDGMPKVLEVVFGISGSALFSGMNRDKEIPFLKLFLGLGRVLTYFSKSCIFPVKNHGLDILPISAILPRCGQWHALFTFFGFKAPPTYGISPPRDVMNLRL
jgi:hypothetical protein